MTRYVKRCSTIWLLLLLLGPAPVIAAEDVLLLDEFDKQGPLDTQTRWKKSGDKVPYCEASVVYVVPGRGFHSRKLFSEPISVRFEKLFMTQSDTRSDNNNIGITPGYSTDMICFRFAHGKIYALRRHKGKVYGAPDKVSPGGWGTLVGKIATRSKDTKISKPYDLRIDWWPGKLARYYVNGKKVAEYFDHVMNTPSPIGVRDERAYFRLGAIKVTRPTESADKILEQRAKAQEAARRAKEAAIRAQQAALQARIDARVNALIKRFPRLRIVIGGPCYFWGIDPMIQRDLRKAGMDVVVWPDAPLLDPEGNSAMGRNPTDYNVIIFGDTFYHLIQPDPNTGEIPKKIRNQVPALRRFLAGGGGIWFCGLGEQNRGRSSHALNYILKELKLDAEVLGEVVKDSEQTKGRGARFPFYAWVDVLRDPLTEGVEHMLSPSGVISGEGSMGVCPILRLSPEWRVLLKGKSTAVSFPADEGHPEGKLLETPGVVKSSPILCAVRQAGKGRVVLWPTWTNFTVTGGSGGMVVDGEHEGRLSDGALLIENLLCWLAEPGWRSRAVGNFHAREYKQPRMDVDVDATLKAWAKPGRRDYPRQFRGLIGAHSNLSDGKSSPEEMIAAARKAGYHFMAFTEDLSKVNEAQWKRLLVACDRANKADSAFIAYPGIDFMDEAGNRGLHFGNRYWIKDQWRSKQDRNRIRWWYNLAYEADADAHRWPPRVIIRSRTNNRRPWHQGLWNLFGAYCYEGGKLVDDSFDEWRPLIGRHVFFLNTGIVTAHTVRSVAEVVASARPGLHQTYIRADNLPQVLSRITGCTGPGFMGVFPTYISSGPEILDFRCIAAKMGGEISFDLAVPGNDRGLLHILVKADAGLQEVSVYDGERLVRRFLPTGKSFENFMTIHGDSCHCYSMTVTDRKGGKAVSWNAFLQIQEKVHRRCGDNWNWMTTGKGSGSLKPPKFSFNLHETTHGWTTKSPEPKKEPARPRYWCEQGAYSHGGLSGAINGYIRGAGLLVDGKAWPAGYPAPAMTLNLDTVGRYGIVLTTFARYEQLIPKLEPYTIGAFSGPYKVVPSPWPAELKQFYPMQKPDGATINRYQALVTFSKSVATPDGKPVRLSLGATGSPSADIVEVMSPDGTSKRQKVGSATISGDIPKHGYICWYDAEGDGVGGVIALTPGIKYSYTKKWQSCFVEVPSPVKPGTAVTWDVIFVTGNRSTTNSNALMEDVRVGMGVSGKPTLYDVLPRTGKVVDQRYFLTLEAEGCAFSGNVVKTTPKPLPIHLPVMVRGLNPRWDAVIWYRGKTNLHTPDYYCDRWGARTWRWVIGKYEPKFDEIRPIPVLDRGIGYCQVDTDKQDPDVFIGNPLVCDHEEVFLSIIKVGKDKCTFELNNPTGKELSCIVRPAQGFTLVHRFEKRIVLPAGGYQVVAVGGKQ